MKTTLHVMEWFSHHPRCFLGVAALTVAIVLLVLVLGTIARVKSWARELRGLDKWMQGK